MKKYLVVTHWIIDGEIGFDILKTDNEEGTEAFHEEIEGYENNNNAVFYSEVTPKLIKKLKDLMDDLNARP